MTQTYRGWSIPETYADRGSDLDECPECGGPKTKHGAMCIACRRRLGKTRRPLAERFWEKVDLTGGPSSCWPFMGARDVHGYGRFSLGRDGTVKANRLAYSLTMGDPGDLYVLHHCDNPPCCNPLHLYGGTQRQNIHDAIDRGRFVPPPRRVA